MSDLTDIRRYRPAVAADRWPRLSRDVAVSFGLSQYFDGPVCAKGHRAGRYVSDRSCVDCRVTRPEKQAEWNRISYRNNREKTLEAQRIYRQAHKTERNVAYKRRKDADPDLYRRWYAANRGTQIEKSRARRAANPEVYAAHHRNRRALKAAAEGTHTAVDIIAIRHRQMDMCAACASPLFGKGHVDHMKPLSKGGSNWPSNLQLLCRGCNLSKHDLDVEEFLRRRARMAA